MMYEDILNNVSKSIQLTKAEEHRFIELLNPQIFTKKTMLLRAGEICLFEGYVHRGCVRKYYLNENGFEVTLSFAVEDWWVSDIASFHEQSPSNLYIETLEECSIYMLSHEAKNKLLQEIPKFERVFRMLVQRRLSTLQNRLIRTLSMPATERYLEFIQAYPSIPNRVAQYYIASYLGVSPEFVSTIRKKLAQENK